MKSYFAIILLILSSSLFATPDTGEVTHYGEATYYTLSPGSGNCSYQLDPTRFFYAAMNKADYDSSTSCGSFVHIVGPKGEATVRIFDQCPECKPGDIDLSKDAFASIADTIDGRVDISWNYIRGTYSEPFEYVAKDGCNRWWFAVQIERHNTSIALVEIEINGVYSPLIRQNYNYWLIKGDIGAGPYYKFRVTDVYGEQIEDNINFNVNLNESIATFAYAKGHTNFTDDLTSMRNRKVYCEDGYSLTVAPTPFENENAKVLYEYPDSAKQIVLHLYNESGDKIYSAVLEKSLHMYDFTKIAEKLNRGTYTFSLVVDGKEKARFRSYKSENRKFFNRLLNN